MSEVYSISVDFDGIFPNTNQLSAEIENSINIITDHIGIETQYDNIVIKFNSNLLEEEKEELDIIVTNHIPNNDPITNNVLTIIPRVSTVKRNQYQRIATFMFPGSTFAKAFSISHMDSEINSYDIRIVDRKNGEVMLTKNLNNTVESIQELGVLNNISSDKTTLEVNVKRNGDSSKKVYIQNINIEYVSNR